MLNKLIQDIRRDYPDVNLVSSSRFKWDPRTQTIHYIENSKNGSWSLLHELGHKVLEHKSYKSDFALLKMEAEAWEKARHLAKEYEIEIDPDHIEKALDSYRNWLYQRSSCRECVQAGLEIETGLYRCINCGFKWKVTPQKFCRVYRKKIEPEFQVL